MRNKLDKVQEVINDLDKGLDRIQTYLHYIDLGEDQQRLMEGLYILDDVVEKLCKGSEKKISKLLDVKSILEREDDTIGMGDI